MRPFFAFVSERCPNWHQNSGGWKRMMLDNPRSFSGERMPDQDQALIPHEPEIPDWETWRQRGACRLWQAVLLTLNIKPTTENRDSLAEEFPEC